mmetsp:Transcript_21396/g.82958  ORF Transcript_21396/g.82958 Transcript_21396/m.82958 type:complete len:308 (-) Transcript_21396:6616-7539(-)
MLASTAAANDSTTSGHMCHTSAKPSSVASIAMTKPAAVFFGMWIGLKPWRGRWWPRCFMSCQASRSCTTGVNAKLYSGGGDEVDHSSVRPPQGSPLGSRSCSRRTKLTTNWISVQAMPAPISSAPAAAIWNQICSDGSSNWLRRRVTPIRPRTYSGMNATWKPTSQNQNEHLPQNGSSLKPKALGNQNVRPANMPKTTPPMITWWKCATRNRLLCSTKSAGGTASSTPVMPPSTKVNMKPTVHSIGTSKRMRPRYIVNSQLKILAPVGMEMIIVVMPKKAFTLAPEPIVKKWCSHTRYDRIVMTTVA